MKSKVLVPLAGISLLLLAGCKHASGSYAPREALEPFPGESYSKLVENAFADVAARPVSTFGLDVDTASYANVRSLLRRGVLPPADAVRIEAFVNAFQYDGAANQGEAVTATSEVQPCPWNTDNLLLRVGLFTPAIEREELPPQNLVFLIDVSGSMGDHNKLPLVQRSLGILLDQLRPQDELAIITYSDRVEVPLERATGSDTERARSVIAELRAAGSTNGANALRHAYGWARSMRAEGETARVLLVTDGDFNVGVQSPRELGELVARKRGEGTFLTVLGCGRGNLKDDKLDAIAGNGDGNYHYLDSVATARRLFGSGFATTLTCVAKDAKVQIEFHPAHVAQWRLLGYESRVLQPSDFEDDKVDGGELGAGQQVTALYELVPKGSKSRMQGVALRYGNERATPTTNDKHLDELLHVSVGWLSPQGGDRQTRRHAVMLADVARRRASRDFHTSATAAGFGLLLRGSKHRGTLDWDQLQRMADRLDTERVDQHELADLIACAAQLTRG